MSKLATANDQHVIGTGRYSLLLNLLPYLLVLLFTIIGVAYTGVNKRPLAHYWELLAIFTGAVCVLSGCRVPRPGMIGSGSFGRRFCIGLPSWQP